MVTNPPFGGSKPVSQQGNTATVRHRRPDVIQCGPVALRLGRTPRVMGIVNVTPDSFSDGGRYYDSEAAAGHAVLLYEAGADIIDIGGESTRPDADPITPGEELDRVLPVLKALANLRDQGAFPVPLSIDTRRAEVAAAALRHGCTMINDVTACSDPEMAGLLTDHPDIPVVIMHMKGTPKSMQAAPFYEDVVGEVAAYLVDRARTLKEHGVSPERIIIDPGIGFGKRFRDNLDLLNRIDSFRALGYPVLIGASRKRFLGELLKTGTENRLPGSLAVAARCYTQGVDIVRVHEVAETAGMFRVLDAMAFPRDYEADW
jgi:dihydropteroate synthase